MKLSEAMEAERLAWSEKEFQAEVIRLAHDNGWLVHHAMPAMNRRGKWATHVQGDSGFPDLVMVRGILVFAELKSAKGRVSEAQNLWLDRLSAVKRGARRFATPGRSESFISPVRVHLWRPSDWVEIVDVLAARP